MEIADLRAHPQASISVPDLAPIRGSTWLDTCWVHICRRLSAIQPSSTKCLQSNRHGHSLAARDGLNINMRSLSRPADVGSYLHIWRRRHECLKNIFGAKILCHVSIHMSWPRWGRMGMGTPISHHTKCPTIVCRSPSIYSSAIEDHSVANPPYHHQRPEHKYPSPHNSISPQGHLNGIWFRAEPHFSNSSHCDGWFRCCSHCS